jgi:peroxiredoxin
VRGRPLPKDSPAQAVGRSRRRVVAGDIVAEHELTTISSETIRFPDADQLVHLQLRRFAGCPICSLHLRSVEQRHDEIAAAGIREVVVFHSPPEEFPGHAVQFPFAVVADPDRRLYAEFGVAPSPRAVLDPRSWWPTLRGLLRSVRAIIRKREGAPAAHPCGGRLGLPADLLIASDGHVIDCKHGRHAYDQWSVDELLARASQYYERSETAREGA